MSVIYGEDSERDHILIRCRWTSDDGEWIDYPADVDARDIYPVPEFGRSTVLITESNGSRSTSNTISLFGPWNSVHAFLRLERARFVRIDVPCNDQATDAAKAGLLLLGVSRRKGV